MRYAVVVIAFLLFIGCQDQGQPIENLAPETQLQVDTIIRSGDLRLGTNVHLHWYGLDQDGYIQDYYVSVNGVGGYTTRTDSLFAFSIDAGVDTADVIIEVAARDNEGTQDPSPARLVVPIKNAAPTVEIDPDGTLPDSAFIVATFDWRAMDADGYETLEDVEIKLNSGPWFSIGTQISLLSFAIDASGEVAFFKNAQFQDSISGAQLNGANHIYMRAVDKAGIYSEVDTTKSFLWAAPQHSTLIINSQAEYLGAYYKSWMDSAGIGYDYIQMDAVTGSGIPAYWDPTYEIIMNSYSQIALFTDATVFPTKSGSDYLLNILALSAQKFLQSGGKLFTASQLSANMAGGAFLDIFPIESLVLSSGQARLTNDSSLVPLQTGFPALRPQNIILGVVPVLPSADATPLYNGQLTKIAGWNGSKIMGATRSQGGSVNQVFIAQPLHVFTRTNEGGKELLNHVFNAVF
ncbi:MAG: hypothetical protein RLZZ599_1304 [Bacteroidota bacterium]|jgi:hypothetical protein